MRVMLATLALNEMEWLPRLVRQHINWPGIVNWTFVESADALYAAANPHMVDKRGLSVDGTTDFLFDFAQMDSRFTYRPQGLVEHSDPAQSKCVSRNVYLDMAERVRPDWIVALDADEFVSEADQETINNILTSLTSHDCLLIRQCHAWRPQSIADRPLLELEAVGAYFSVPHIRIWKWWPGMMYTTNHNHPHTKLGNSLAKRCRKVFGPQAPEIVHTGFASSLQSRVAKTNYYGARGEGPNDGRQMYMDVRRAWEAWMPGDPLPHGAEVVPYAGPKPEALCV